MADKKITELNALTTPVGEDLFAVVDIDANETKKTTYADLTASLQEDIVNSITGSLVNTSYGLFNQTGSYTGVSASLDETSLIGGGVGTLSVPANGFRQGDAYQATFSGTCLFHNGDTLRLRVKADGILLADTGLITLTRADAERWNLTIDFSIHQIGAATTASLVSTGIFQYTQHAASIFSGKNFGFTNNPTFDTTISNQLEVTAQFNHNDNVISTDIFTLRKIY